MALPSYYNDLFDRLAQGRLSPEEADELISLLAGDQPDLQAAELLLERLRQKPSGEISPEITAALEARLPAILLQPSPRIPFFKKIPFRYSAAAAVILWVIGSWMWMQKGQPSPQLQTHTPVQVAHDTAKGVTLTLGDGRTVMLDSMRKGIVATQNGSTILLGDGRLTYQKKADAGTVTYNTVTTTRGRQFQLLLPDGTRVWLDAASSMRYPTAFTGSERSVEITGEAYFEVARKPAMPFRVKVQGRPGEIEVLGTRFNVNAYSNEASIRTTLLEGSVKISNGNGQVVIKPGQQAQAASGINVLNGVDLNKVMAWKEGVFDFEDAGLEEVMRQLERWYDIEVVYEKGIPPIEFVGKMGRDLTLPEVLRGLEVSEVHFSMQGRTLLVKP